jgi:hypothetical protein
VKHAKMADGEVRISRMLLVAAAEMRKCPETSVGFFQTTWEVDQVDRLHDAILEEIRKASPEIAEAILRRIDARAASWTG